MQQWLMVVALALCASACTKTQLWAPRLVPGCSIAGGNATLDRERGYHAALLALNDRKYAILGSEAPRHIEAEYRSDSKPERDVTRWALRVRDDGALEVHSLPEATAVTRKQETWFERLSASLRKYQCRDLNWLRWEAQNRGLVPMLAALPAAAPDAGPGAGGETPPGASMSTPPATRGRADPLEMAALELQRERREIKKVGPIMLISFGAGFFGVGAVTLAVYSAFNYADVPTTEQCDAGDCQERRVGAALAVSSVASGLACAAMVGVGGARLARGLRRERAIDGELRRLFTPAVSVEPGLRGVQLGLRARF